MSGRSVSAGQTYRPPKSDSVIKATGHDYDYWFALLDRWNGPTLGHKEMARRLGELEPVSAWWAQTITVEYERTRGLREVRQRADRTYDLTVHRTVAATLEAAWAAWATPAGLNGWFTSGAKVDLRVGGRFSNDDKDAGQFKIVEPHKRLRFTWEQPQHQPGSEVTITLETMDSGKVRVALEHRKLQTREDCDDLREGWSWAMESLKSWLETGRGIRFEEWKAERTGV
ncbi:MAG: hypothetical protein FJY67_02625 [Calditrichaeota bacterium]|nr:hypothetical protein [Calditrichota bacterium]